MATMNKETPVLDTVRDVIDHAGASRVFGTPVSQDGITVVPVAKVSGGGGGGGGMSPAEGREEASGSGGGVGVTAKPMGVYVVKDKTVSWRPAVDANKVIMGTQIVAVTALLVLRAIMKSRGRAMR
jgi:uncharacterized spore protein YtfJ